LFSKITELFSICSRVGTVVDFFIPGGVPVYCSFKNMFMKQILVLMCVASVTIGFIARQDTQSGIHGTIEPADGARKVWAISGMDSFSTIPVAGKFSVNVRPGNWGLLLEANAPYKNTAVNNLLVIDNQSTDAGVIRMNQ
jgi:hypothetical protein